MITRIHVVLFLLEKNNHASENGGGFCYPHDHYLPFTFQIFGKYNDYGGIEQISKNETLVWDHIQTMHFEEIPIEINRNRLSGEPKDLEEFINKYVERGVYKNIGFMLVKEYVFHDTMNFFSQQIEAFKAGAREFYKEYEKAISEAESEREVFGIQFSITRKVQNKFTNILGSYEAKWMEFKQYLFENPKNFNLAEQLISLKIMDIALEKMRKFWTIQSGNGSQESLTDFQQFMAFKTCEYVLTERTKQKFHCDELTEEQYEAYEQSYCSEEEFIEQLTKQAKENLQKIEQTL